LPGDNSELGLRIDSWKEIAAYLKRDARTVQRWESVEGLPIHRHVHRQRSSVFAYSGELDRWWSTRKEGFEVKTTSTDEAHKAHRRFWYVVAAATLCIIGIVVWAVVSRRSAVERLTVRPLTSDPGLETQPSFSPDGSKLAYACAREDSEFTDICVKSLGVGDLLRITNTPESPESSPVWSPDGNWIAFRGLREDKYWVLVSPSSGGLERRVSRSAPLDNMVPNYLCWSPDGQMLILPDRESDAEPYALTVISVATGEKRKLMEPPPGATGDSSPSVSADGRTLAFVRGSADFSPRIYLATLSPSFRVVGIAAPLAQEENVAEQVSWVGHEHQLAYAYPWYSKGTQGVWTLRANRAERPRLLFAASDPASLTATVSPDGRRLAYSAEKIDAHIWRVDLLSNPIEESIPLRIQSSTAMELNPDSSADGRWLAFSSTRSGHSEIWISFLDGSQANQLTHMEGPLTGSPHWSPDGNRIAFDSTVQFNSDIWVINADGGTPTRLTSELSSEYSPSWSRDGRWIYFTSNRSGRHEIWKMPAQGGPAVQVTRSGGLGGFESPDGKYLYYGSKHFGAELRRIPVEGGVEVTLGPKLRITQDMRVGKTGVYFVPLCPSCQRLEEPYPLQRYRFSDGKVETVARFKLKLQLGIAVSADESYVFVSGYTKTTGNIMIVDGLR
jgi:Tol biopolymer transport system component